MHLKCDACGSTDFSKESETTYRCSYCFSITIIAPNQMNDSIVNNSTNLKGIFLIGLIILLITITGAITLFMKKKSFETYQVPKINESILKKNEMVESNSVEVEPEPEGKLSELTSLPDSIGNIYFVGFFENIGKISIEKPRVDLTFFNSKKQKVATAFGFVEKNYLTPGESGAIKILLNDAPTYSYYESKIELQKISYSRGKPQIDLKEMKLEPGEHSKYVLKGIAENSGNIIGLYVQITAVIFGKDKKIIGMESSFIQAKKLSPGKSEPFSIDYYFLREKPASFKAYADGLEDK